jgi:hypothetical protein
VLTLELNKKTKKKSTATAETKKLRAGNVSGSVQFQHWDWSLSRSADSSNHCRIARSQKGVAKVQAEFAPNP